MANHETWRRTVTAPLRWGKGRAGSLLQAATRNPGADLSRLPIGLNPRALNVAEGVRAALACAVIIGVEHWVQWPPLLYMALAANLTCFADAGGPLRGRLMALLSFSIIGAMLWSGFGLLRATGLAIVIPIACFVIFCNSFARVWGTSALAVGSVLTVALVFSLDRSLDLTQAAVIGGSFIAGGIWATLMALVIWRLDPYRPTRTAVAGVWRLLAAMTVDLRGLLRRGEVSAAEWDSHARSHRRAIREAIEAARIAIADLARMRGSLSERSSRALLRLEAGEQLFGALVALADLLSEDAPPARRRMGRRLVRLLAPLLSTVAVAMRSDTLREPAALDRALSRLTRCVAADPALQAIAETVVDRLRIVSKLYGSEEMIGGKVAVEPAPASAWERMIDPIRANMTWDSAILRHALRAALVAAPALTVTLIWQGVFTHWLTITVVLTMQPFFAATWQRALERIGGTVLGGLVGAVLVHAATTPLALAALMFPLCVLGFAARQVSYGAFIACMVPQLVVLVELIQPGHSSWEIVEMRALFTILGGMMAVVGCLLLWPSWEPPRLSRDLRAALGVYAAYADAVFADMAGEVLQPSLDQRRRRAGVAMSNLEACISRALQEPRQSKETRQWLEAVMVADATLRRFGGRLLVLHHDRASRASLDAAGLQGWRSWITAALSAFADGRTPPHRGLDEPQVESLGRMARQIELLEGALAGATVEHPRKESVASRPV
ncbi:MAG: FUSC family protein [Rhodospirillales bacterium]